MTDRHSLLIASLGLVSHPEGGYYREVYRSPSLVQPSDGRDARSALTTIYFLLPAGAISRWHRVRSDEVWHFYEGAPLQLLMAPPRAENATMTILGPVDESQRSLAIVPAGWWQAARSTGTYTLVGCTVGPGFDFRDFALASEEPAIAAALRTLHPPCAELL